MTTTTSERIIARPYQDDPDFERIRTFLVENYDPVYFDHNWEIRRWEGWRYWCDPADRVGNNRPWAEYIRLWETESGKLVGVVHPEGIGDVFLEIHPDYRHLEDEMIEWAEANLGKPTEDGQRRVQVDVYEYDTQRQELLTRRGYQKTADYGYSRRRSMDQPIPDVVVPEGYTVRGSYLADDELQRWTDVTAAVFPHARATIDVYRTFQTMSPSYRHDLHLVAVAPDGSFAAFCGITYMPTIRVGIFEPVGTHPDHRRKGLQRVLMAEGLRRLAALGAKEAVVGTGDMIPANTLYETMGFTDAHISWFWQKIV